MQLDDQQGKTVHPGGYAPPASQPAPDPGARPPAPALAAGSTGLSIGSIETYTVAEIREDAVDARGARIRRVYFKRRSYAIYTSGEQVHIQYADDPDAASQQIANVARLIPLRDRLTYLIQGSQLPDCYRLQIAEALRLGLEGQADVAQSTLEEALGDAHERLARQGRIAYVGYAALFATLSLVAAVIARFLPVGAGQPLVFGAAAGAIGALFSIALAIRARTVVVDTDRKTNAWDGAIRVGIGAIAGAMLHLFLSAGIVSPTSVGSLPITGDHPAWQMAVIAGFAAGFLERLVPDILEKGRPPDDPAEGKRSVKPAQT